MSTQDFPEANEDYVPKPEDYNWSEVEAVLELRTHNILGKLSYGLSNPDPSESQITLP